MNLEVERLRGSTMARPIGGVQERSIVCVPKDGVGRWLVT